LESTEGSNGSSPLNDRQRRSILDGFSEGSDEHRVLVALLDSDYSRRTLGGVAKSSGLSRSAVRRVFDKLVREGRLVETISSKSGSPLYALRLT
jgi:predicted ArsR family transcriptional regulator